MGGLAPKSREWIWPRAGYHAGANTFNPSLVFFNNFALIGLWFLLRLADAASATKVLVVGARRRVVRAACL